MSSALLNTHTYDGQLAPAASVAFRALLLRAAVLGEGERETAVSALRSHFAARPAAAAWVVAIWRGGAGGNWDAANLLDAREVLAAAALLAIDLASLPEPSGPAKPTMADKAAPKATPGPRDTFLALLGEQLEGIAGGPCPQGRTTRILNAVSPFLEFARPTAD